MNPPDPAHHTEQEPQMLQTLIALGLLLTGFIVADWVQLNGGGWIIGIIYLVIFTPVLIREVVRLVRK